MLPLTELGHGRQGQTKMGGVKQVSNPHVRVKDEVVCLSDAWNAPTHLEVPTPIVEEWHCTL